MNAESFVMGCGIGSIGTLLLFIFAFRMSKLWGWYEKIKDGLFLGMGRRGIGDVRWATLVEWNKQQEAK
jgi:hypothetical protein